MRAGSRIVGSVAAEYIAATIWLGFIALPLIGVFGSRSSLPDRVLAVGGAAAFVASYLAIMFCQDSRDPLERSSQARRALFWLLVAVSVVLTFLQAHGWGFLFIFCAACAALIWSTRVAFLLVLGCATLAVLGTVVSGLSGVEALSNGAGALGIGFLLLLLSDAHARNQELDEARAELARLAVAAERERFARDLHDLLGHTLSVIAIKAELAGRLLSVDASRAAAEIGDVERVARAALGEVRQAVSGYRQPTLDGELKGARMALAAAGISVEVSGGAQTPLDPGVEAVLAWALREGATNVIRHSGARHCVLRVTSGVADVGVEVLDDGSDVVNGSSPGHGLDGLRERVSAVHGVVSSGPRPDGGYRLAVSIPVPSGGPK